MPRRNAPYVPYRSAYPPHIVEYYREIYDNERQNGEHDLDYLDHLEALATSDDDMSEEGWASS